MNAIQAMIILTNGIRKYGTIINGEYEGRIQFIPSSQLTDIDKTTLCNLVEYIPVSHIYSIDTFLK